MPAERPYKVLTESVKEIKYEHFITMNFRNTGNVNPVVLSMLRSTTPGVFAHVELGELDDEGAQAALAAATADSPGRLPLRMADSGTSARFSMTRLVAAHPALKVTKGRVRKFPVKVDDSGTFLILNLKESSVEVVDNLPKQPKLPPGESAAAELPENETDE